MRLKKLLEAKKLWSTADDKKLEADVQAFVEKTVQDLEAVPRPTPDEIFQSTFADLPPRLQHQLEDAQSYAEALQH